jgi:hypothetical protein
MVKKLPAHIPHCFTSSPFKMIYKKDSSKKKARCSTIN